MLGLLDFESEVRLLYPLLLPFPYTAANFQSWNLSSGKSKAAPPTHGPTSNCGRLCKFLHHKSHSFSAQVLRNKKWAGVFDNQGNVRYICLAVFNFLADGSACRQRKRDLSEWLASLLDICQEPRPDL